MSELELKTGVAMSWECIFYWIEQHPGLASWVQALGAIFSIWVAWLIARSQAKKIERQSLRQDESKCNAVIQILRHAKLVIKSNFDMSNNSEKIERFRVDLSRLILLFGEVRLFDVPSADTFDALCIVRRDLEEVAIRFRRSPHFGEGILGINFRRGEGARMIELLDQQIERCEAAVKSLRK